MFSRLCRIWSFHVVALKRMAKKYTKDYNARAQLLFCSLNLLLSNVPIAIVVFLSSLFKTAELPALSNDVSSIYLLFVAHFAMSVFMCIYTAERVVQILLNSLDY